MALGQTRQRDIYLNFLGNWTPLPYFHWCRLCLTNDAPYTKLVSLIGTYKIKPRTKLSSNERKDARISPIKNWNDLVPFSSTHHSLVISIFLCSSKKVIYQLADNHWLNFDVDCRSKSLILSLKKHAIEISELHKHKHKVTLLLI